MQKEFLLIDETFDVNNSSSYELSIQFGMGSFLFLVLDVSLRKCIVAGKYSYNENLPGDELHGDIHKLLQGETIFSSDFKQVTFNIRDKRASIVPDDLFDPMFLKRYLEVSYVVEEYDIIQYQDFDENSKLVYLLDNTISNLLQDFFPKVKMQHYYALLHAILASGGKDGVVISLFGEKLDAIVVANGSPVCASTYWVQCAEDTVKQVSELIRTFFPNKETRVILAGELSKRSEEVGQIKNNCGSVQFLKPTDNVSFSYLFAKANHNEFLPLISLPR